MQKAKLFFLLARIALGLQFLWAFFDKMFGLGFATTSAQAWLHGGSPTTGFLKMAVHGPLAPLYHALAGQPIVDWLFMLGLLGIGISLVFGIFVRVGATCGAILVTLMWLSLLPPPNNPIIDEHVVYAFLLIGVALDSTLVKKRWPSFR